MLVDETASLPLVLRFCGWVAYSSVLISILAFLAYVDGFRHSKNEKNEIS
jgi:hypothetical protein